MMEYRTASCQVPYRPVQSNQVNVTARPKPCKMELMDKINQYSFAVNEATLFLDTHPCDQEAIKYFQKYRALRMEAIEEYEKYFAPLLIDHTVSNETTWTWAEKPWPWEGMGC